MFNYLWKIILYFCALYSIILFILSSISVIYTHTNTCARARTCTGAPIVSTLLVLQLPSSMPGVNNIQATQTCPDLCLAILSSASAVRPRLGSIQATQTCPDRCLAILSSPSAVHLRLGNIQATQTCPDFCLAILSSPSKVRQYSSYANLPWLLFSYTVVSVQG